MTTRQLATITRINAQLEQERDAADQASRDAAELDPRAVLAVVTALIEDGQIERAKAIVKQWKAGTL